MSRRQASSLPRQYVVRSSTGYFDPVNTTVLIVQASDPGLPGSIIGGVVAVVLVLAVTVIVLVIAILLANHHRAKMFIHQDVSRSSDGYNIALLQQLLYL